MNLLLAKLGSVDGYPETPVSGMGDEVMILARLILMGLVPLLFWTAVTGAGCWLVYYLVTLPVRRRERARLFLQLLETETAGGKSPEAALGALAGCPDPSIGLRFRMVTLHLQQGQSLAEALALVPSFLPARIHALLLVGLELGNLNLVLPACRRLLGDADSQTRAGVGCVTRTNPITLVATPLLTILLAVFVMPKFRLIADDMVGPEQIGTMVDFTWNNAILLTTVVCIPALAVVLLLSLAYLGGPRLRRLVRFDRIDAWLPWRRQRLHRDFAGTLALLLDAGLPEARAVKLAAEGTANRHFIQQADGILRALAAGETLPAALVRFDHSRELHWRLTNALRGTPRRFAESLQGWLEWLDAKASQKEQVATQVVNTALTLANGIVVALIAASVFLFLTNLIDHVFDDLPW